MQCLAEIAHTLLKIAPYDPATMKSVGLKRSVILFNLIALFLYNFTEVYMHHSAY